MRGGRRASRRQVRRERPEGAGSIEGGVEGVRRGEARAGHALLPSSASHRSISAKAAGDDAGVGCVVRPRERRPVASSGATRSRGSATASIAPGGHACISATPLGDECQRLVPAPPRPARQAATYSPTLWPIRASGTTPQRHPQPRQRVLDDEQGGLGERGLGEPAGGRVGLRRPPGRAASRRSRPSRGRRTRSSRRPRPEDRLRLVEIPAHADVLRALPGQEERHAGRPLLGDVPVTHAPGVARLREPPRRVREVPAHEGAAVRERARGPTRSVKATSASVQVGWPPQVSASALAARPSGDSVRAESTSRRAAPGLAQAAGAAGGSSSTTWAFVPPDAERADARPGAGRPAHAHGSRRVHDAERRRLAKSMPRVGPLEVQARRELAVLAA